MVCRENPAGSLAIALARRGTWFDDAQLQSVFHRLSHEYHPDAPPPGYDRYRRADAAFAHHRAALERDTVLGQQQRRALERRLAAAVTARDECPDGVYWAIGRFAAGLAESQRALDGRLREIAGQRGMTMREARSEFFALRASMPGVGRGGNTAPTAQERAELGVIPSDGRTRYALSQMRARDPVTTPHRIVDRVIAAPEGLGAGTDDPDRVVRVGWSVSGRRVETYSASGGTRAFAVSIADTDLLEERGARATAGQILAITSSGSELARAEQTAFAPRCEDCGRFTDAHHLCAARVVDTADLSQTYALRGAELTHPPLTMMAEIITTAPNGQGLVPIDMMGGDHRVEGYVRVQAGDQAARLHDRATRLSVDIDAVNDGLRCTCGGAPHCEHVQQAAEMLRTSIARAEHEPRSAAIDELMARVQPVRAEPVRSPGEASTPSVSSPTVSFADDPSTFRDVILGSGRNVPFYSGGDGQPVLTGYAANARFGIEIEFNSDDLTSQTRNRVIANLNAAGLIRAAHASGYHSAASSGHTRWVLENDGSVHLGGELVTPVLGDDAASWAQLATACSAIAVEGVHTHWAGSHTNISADDYTPETAWRLAVLFRQHEDDLFRMGRTRGSRRSNGYRAPVEDPGPRWLESHQGRSYRYVHGSAVNLTHMQGANPRIEFRFPDASHDAGVIQAQVRLCAALTNYVRTNDVDPTAPARPYGTSYAEGWTRSLMNSSTTPDEFARRTEPVRRLIDTLFDTDQARLQTAILWGRGAYR